MRWMARGESGIPPGELWLRGPERQRAAGMRFTKRRTEYLLRRLAGKSAVAAVLGLPADAATFGRIGVLNHPTGAPYVTVDDQPAGLEVSLTDRAGWAVCLAGQSLGALGVDLEIVEPRSDGFVRDFLTPSEQAAVAACAAHGPDGHDAAANLIWSAKESALKVLRLGLRADTRTVQVHLPDPTEPARVRPGAGWSPLRVATGIGDMPGWWRREGWFLLTVVAAPGAPVGAPDELPGSEPLLTAVPVHSWLERPLADSGPGSGPVPVSQLPDPGRSPAPGPR